MEDRHLIIRDDHALGGRDYASAIVGFQASLRDADPFFAGFRGLKPG